MREKLAELIDSVYQENLRLNASELVLLTFGNVSAVSRELSIAAIKPSGVDYAKLKREDIVLCDLDGRPVESELRPSSDLPTHLALYKAFPEVGAVVHTHSPYATAFAQARRSLPCLGTTHADYFHGDVPVTDPMTDAEIKSDYEANTGAVIVRKFKALGLRAGDCPAVLVANHGPFCWGGNAAKAVENAIVLENLCKMACFSILLTGGKATSLSDALLDKHYFRKHGKSAYYGQRSGAMEET